MKNAYSRQALKARLMKHIHGSRLRVIVQTGPKPNSNRSRCGNATSNHTFEARLTKHARGLHFLTVVQPRTKARPVAIMQEPRLSRPDWNSRLRHGNAHPTGCYDCDHEDQRALHKGQSTSSVELALGLNVTSLLGEPSSSPTFPQVNRAPLPYGVARATPSPADCNSPVRGHALVLYPWVNRGLERLSHP